MTARSHGRHADFETRERDQSSVEPDRDRSSAGRQTLGEPTRRRQAIHEPPDRRPTERYEPEPDATGTSHTSRRFTRPTLRLPTRWPWATTFTTALDTLR